MMMKETFRNAGRPLSGGGGGGGRHYAPEGRHYVSPDTTYAPRRGSGRGYISGGQRARRKGAELAERRQGKTTKGALEVPMRKSGKGFWYAIGQILREQFEHDYDQPWANQGGTQVAPAIAGFSLEKQCTVAESLVCGFVSGYWTAPGPADPTYPRCDICIPALPQSQDMPTIATPLSVGDWLLQDGLAAAGQNGPYRWYKRRNGELPVFLPGYAKPLPDPDGLADAWPEMQPWVDPALGTKPGGSTKVGETNKPEPYAPPYAVADPGRGNDIIIGPPGDTGEPPVTYRPPPHRPGRPPYHRNVPDRKPKINMPPWLFGLMRAYHGGTEVMEAFDCMFDALPAEVRGDHIPGSEWGHGGKVSGLDKIGAVLGNLGAVDWGEATKCLIYNQLIEDKAVGAFMRKLGSNFQAAGGPNTTQLTNWGRQMKGIR